MAIYGSDLTFKRPTKAQVPLTDDLLSVIHQHHRKSREHLFHLCMIAYGLRTHNLMKPKSGAGGNAQGRVYKPKFREWYSANNLVDVYGSLPNFTLYAMAGRLLEYVQWQVDTKHISNLPSSVTALYALSQIVWSQGDKATPESRKLFDKALHHPIKDGSKHNALIHPRVTRKEIDDWRATQSGKPAKIDLNDTHTVVVATVRVHEDLFKFVSVSGAKLVGPKLSDVKELTDKLQSLIAEFDKGKARFALESHIDQVTLAYEAAAEPDYAKDILDVSPAKTKGAKKP
jgi:hypothetical protein